MKKFFLFLPFFLTSCGLLISGKSHNINLIPSDTTSKSEVEISGVGVKTLPASVTVPRSSNVVVISVKENDCYKASQSFVASKFNPMSLLNLLGITSYSSTTSTTVDVATGAIWTYDDNVVVNLTKKDSCSR